MSDFLVKLRILWGFVRGSVDTWREEVWSRDLDQHYCCDGRECGCSGQTVRDIFGPAAKEEGK